MIRLIANVVAGLNDHYPLVLDSHVQGQRVPNRCQPAYREPDEVFGLLLAGVVEVLDPEVEDLFLGMQLGVFRPLSELGYELDVADGRLEIPADGDRLYTILIGDKAKIQCCVNLSSILDSLNL